MQVSELGDAMCFCDSEDWNLDMSVSMRLERQPPAGPAATFEPSSDRPHGHPSILTRYRSSLCPRYRLPAFAKAAARIWQARD